MHDSHANQPGSSWYAICLCTMNINMNFLRPDALGGTMMKQMNAQMHIQVRVCCQSLVPNLSLDLLVNRKQTEIKESCTQEPASPS